MLQPNHEEDKKSELGENVCPCSPGSWVSQEELTSAHKSAFSGSQEIIPVVLGTWMKPSWVSRLLSPARDHFYLPTPLNHIWIIRPVFPPSLNFSPFCSAVFLIHFGNPNSHQETVTRKKKTRTSQTVSQLGSMPYTQWSSHSVVVACDWYLKKNLILTS